MTLQDLHRSKGAKLAQDGIPLHYGDLAAEYHAAIEAAIILDRSHEGRIQITGKDRFEIINRISTNEVVNMQPGEGRPTIFITANGRIIDRIYVYNREDHLLVITEPGQGAAMEQFLQRQIFFNDDARVHNISEVSMHFTLHGAAADQVIGNLAVPTNQLEGAHSLEHKIGDVSIFIGRKKPVVEAHWLIISSAEDAEDTYRAILKAGQPYGLLPAGSLTYNTLRIRAGRPARPELNNDYIPLEIGLWDEVSFSKGCYTGQEIIARMESRGQLAKTIVTLKLSAFVPAPAKIFAQGREIGKMTSSVQAPSDEIFALGVIKTKSLEPELTVTVGENAVEAIVGGLVGVQPDWFGSSQ